MANKEHLTNLAKRMGPGWQELISMSANEVSTAAKFSVSEEDRSWVIDCINEYLSIREQIKMLLNEAEVRKTMVFARGDIVIHYAEQFEQWAKPIDDNPNGFYALIKPAIVERYPDVYDDVHRGLKLFREALEAVNHVTKWSMLGKDKTDRPDFTGQLRDLMARRASAHDKSNEWKEEICELVDMMYRYVKDLTVHFPLDTAIGAMKALEVAYARIGVARLENGMVHSPWTQNVEKCSEAETDHSEEELVSLQLED